jgi:hypothetical protein
MIFSQQGARQVFDNARRVAEAAGLSTNATVMSQSYLRSEAPISTTTTQYHMPVLINDNQNGANASFNTMNLLNLQDAFVVSGIFVGFGLPSSATDATFIPRTYPSAINCGGTQAAATAMYTLYNGQLQLSVNNRQILTAFPITNNYFVPQTQGLATQTSPGSTPWVAIDQNDGFQSATVPIEPNIVLIGSKNNVLSISLPAAIATSPGTYARLIVIFTGILMQNCTPVR